MKQTKIGQFKIQFRENTSDEEVLGHSFDNDIFFKNLYEYAPRKNHLIMDVGAHIGTFSLVAAAKVSRGKVYAFEPCRETFQVLESNLEINTSENIKSFRQALSNHSGTARLYHDSEYANWGHSMTKNLSDRGENVETISMTDFFARENINKCHLVKFNCEGSEFDIILSTPPSILKKIDNMLILYHEDLAEGRSHHELINYLKENNYSIHKIHESTDPPRGWLIAYKGGRIKKLFIQLKCAYFRKLRPSISYKTSRVLDIFFERLNEAKLFFQR